jgi:hypothetical protein
VRAYGGVGQCRRLHGPGRNFPLGKLETRLICPTYGSGDVNVIFEPPMVRTVVGRPAKGKGIQ